MARLGKQMYFNAKGEKKVNCYKVNIPKEVVEKSGIKETENIKTRAENGRIIIEREK